MVPSRGSGRRAQPGGKIAFSFASGTAYAYAGEVYDYAARFAEHRLGRDFEALAQQLVFDPIGMKSTSYSRRVAVVFTSGENGVRPYVDVLRLMEPNAPILEYVEPR